METCSPSKKNFKRSDSRKSVRPGGKSWKKLDKRSTCKYRLQSMIQRKRMLKK